MLIRRRTGLMATHTVVAAVVNLAGCVVLVPLWGNYGAAIATCLGFAYLAAGFYLSAQQIDRVPYDVRRAVVVGALALPYLALGQVMIGPLWLSVVAKLTVVALLPVGLWRAGVVQIGSGGRR
jgi:O-antigen/teichoic acid export membrane protein